MQRDEALLSDMLQHAEEALSLVRGRDRKDLDRDRLLSLAVVRLLEMVGEAASKTSPELRLALPQVPWPAIVAMRNRLVHGYGSVDHDIVWQVLVGDLPPLVETLRSWQGDTG